MLDRLRRDLERRGLAEAAAHRVAVRIAPQIGELAEDALATFLDGVATAHHGEAEPRSATPRAGDREAGAAEIQRLVQDFAIELKKLDEGLRLLSSYLLRIRDRAGKDSRDGKDGPRTRVIH